MSDKDEQRKQLIQKYRECVAKEKEKLKQIERYIDSLENPLPMIKPSRLLRENLELFKSFAEPIN
jgi:hypothetical protein